VYGRKKRTEVRAVVAYAWSRAIRGGSSSGAGGMIVKQVQSQKVFCEKETREKKH